MPQMDPLTDPGNVALMRAPPALQVQKDYETFRQSTYEQDIVTNVQYYWTPRSAPRPAAAVHPGPPPAAPVPPVSPPVAQRGRPNAARRALVTQYNADLISYAADFVDHPRRLQAHADALAKYAAEVDMKQGILAPHNGPADASLGRPEPDLIFTHGRGSTLDRPSFISFCNGFARTQTIFCFEDRGDMVTRVGRFRALMHHFHSVTTVGGRSMGARASCRSALYSHIKKLIFLTYPLIGGLEERYEELLALDADTDVLFIVGDSDPRCVEILLQPVRRRMRARTWWIRIVGADHGIYYDDAQVRDTICNVAGQIAAMWNIDENRDPAATELTLGFDAATQQVTWTGWMALPPQ